MTDLELAMKLAELRARAAERCGLRRYPAELIHAGEAIDRRATGGRVVPPKLAERYAQAVADFKWDPGYWHLPEREG